MVGVPFPFSGQNTFIVILQLIKSELFAPERLDKIEFISEDAVLVQHGVECGNCLMSLDR